MKIVSFSGEAPMIDSEQLGNEQSVLAINCDFSTSMLEPSFINSQETHSLPTTTLSFFKYTNTKMLSWDRVVNVVRSPIAQDDRDRIYFSDGVKPQVLSNDSYPASFDLGVPAPSNEITIGVIGELIPDGAEIPDIAELTDDTTRFYLETYVTAYGEEGSNGPVSSEVNLPNQYSTVDLTLSTLVINTNNITHRRIYRTANNGAVSGYFLVAELPIITNEFTDTLPDSSLGPELTTSEYEVPPNNIKGMILHAGGYTVAFAGNEIVQSEPYLLYAYPLANRHSIEYDIVAMAAVGDMVVVATKGKPYALIGSSPSASQVTDINLMEPCVSALSMVDMGKFAMYASINGLVAVGSSGAELITETILDKKSWSQFRPEEVKAFLHDNKYIAFNSVGGFIYDPVKGNLSRLSSFFDCGYHDLEKDELYLSLDGSVTIFQGGNSSEVLTWQSKQFLLPDSSYFSWVWIETPDINKVTFKLWVNGELSENLSFDEIYDNRFRIKLIRGQLIQFEITSSVKIKRITFGQNVMELR